jgi:hypothetical protein
LRGADFFEGEGAKEKGKKVMEWEWPVVLVFWKRMMIKKDEEAITFTLAFI